MDFNNYTPDNRPNQFEEKKTDSFAIAALVMALLSVVGICCTYLGIILGILAIVFSFISKSRTGSFSGMAIAALVIGIITTVLCIALTVVGFLLIQTPEYQQMYQQMLEGYENFFEKAQ